MDELRIVTLASGSKANCTYIKYKKTELFLDCGVSFRELKSRLVYAGITPQPSALLITHEHSDHVYGLEQFTKQTQVPVYAHNNTWCALCRTKKLANHLPIDYYDGGFSIGDIGVQPFRVMHDAAYPVGYSFFCGREKITYCTDSGCVTKGIADNIANSSVLLLESNHDINMLKTGPYPPQLKQRILSNLGHLSNTLCASTVQAELRAHAGIRTLALMHLSQHNNTPELAQATMEAILLAEGRQDITLLVTRQDAPVLIK